jgi:hypothetical protein
MKDIDHPELLVLSAIVQTSFCNQAASHVGVVDAAGSSNSQGASRP